TRRSSDLRPKSEATSSSVRQRRATICSLSEAVIGSFLTFSKNRLLLKEQIVERGGDRIFPDFLDQMLREYKIEGGKFHVAGPSNGGLSAFHIASMYPRYFRSVTGFPGYLREESEAKLNALKPLCLYMHVGERDLEWQMPMQRQSDLLRENGFHVRFTIEPDQGHGIQTLTGDGAGRLFE